VTAIRSRSGLPPTASLLPDGPGTAAKDCHTATLYRGSGSLAVPGEPPAFDLETMVRCADYHAHQLRHVRDGAGWRCPVCDPVDGVA
jgi:hypothetical protein